MTKKTHKLNYLPDYNFKILGIISDEKDYKLVWNINNNLKWDFVREENYQLYNNKSKSERQFPHFSFTNDENYTTYKLLANKHEGLPLLEELKNIDYLLIIYDESGSENIPELTEKLKKIDSIRGVFHIKPDILRNKELLDFH